MKWIWLFLLIIVGAVEAQTPLVGDYNTKSLAWDWSPGPTGGEPTTTFVRCGILKGGPYTAVPQQAVAMPLQEIRFNKMVPRQGKYFCILVGWNETGEGPSSDEIPLDLKGGLPPKPINIRVK